MVVVGFPWPATKPRHHLKTPKMTALLLMFVARVYQKVDKHDIAPETSDSARMTSALLNWLACWGYVYSYMDWHRCNKQPLACSCLQLWSIQACRVWVATTCLCPEAIWSEKRKLSPVMPYKQKKHVFPFTDPYKSHTSISVYRTRYK